MSTKHKYPKHPELDLDPKPIPETTRAVAVLEPAIRVTHQGELPFGEIRVRCAVTEDGRRVLSMRALMEAIAQNGNQKASECGSKWPASLTRTGLEPYLGAVLSAAPNQPFLASVPRHHQSGHPLPDNRALVVRAEILVDICRAYVRADAAGDLHPKQKHVAARALQILSELAGHAMRDLIDKATGYSPAPPPPPRPPSHAEALRGWAHAIEQSEALAAQVVALKPAAEAWDSMAATSRDYSVGDAAKILSRDSAINTGRQRLFDSLVELDMVFVEYEGSRGQRKGYKPKQQHVDAGRLALRLGGRWQHPKTLEWEAGTPQLRVTAKGLAYLLAKLGGADPLQLDEPEGPLSPPQGALDS